MSSSSVVALCGRLRKRDSVRNQTRRRARRMEVQVQAMRGVEALRERDGGPYAQVVRELDRALQTKPQTKHVAS